MVLRPIVTVPERRPLPSTVTQSSSRPHFRGSRLGSASNQGLDAVGPDDKATGRPTPASCPVLWAPYQERTRDVARRLRNRPCDTSPVHRMRR
jgi:hypothetical protein